MVMTRGWHGHSYQHSLASRGFKVYKDNFKSKGIYIQDKNDVKRKIKKGIGIPDEDYKTGHNEMYNKYLSGNCGLYALFLNKYFGFPIYGLWSDEQDGYMHYAVEVDGELYDALGELDDERKYNYLMSTEPKRIDSDEFEEMMKETYELDVEWSDLPDIYEEFMEKMKDEFKVDKFE